LPASQIRAAVATAHGKNREAKRLIAYVVAAEAGDRPKVEDLKAFLATTIPEYMIPDAWIWLADIPLSANGKVDRKALPDLEQGQKNQAFAAPETELEQELATLFAGVLEVERVGRLDNFFEMGGNSIMVVRLISLVRETYQVELSLRDFFLKPTIAELAENIDVLRWATTQHGTDAADENLRSRRDMMTVLELLAYLKERCIEVWADAGALRFSAPKGAMTAELKQQLTDRKAELLAFLDKLRSEQMIARHDSEGGE
jgi:acyl carrier protein